MSSRRDFLKVIGMGAVVLPTMAAGEVVALGRKKPEALPLLNKGDVLTAEHYAEVTRRINALSEALL